MNAEAAVKLLIEKGKKLATAESCTGGMLGSLITAVSGSSAVYEFGFITYANKAKESLIGVRHETLEKYGAVSSTVAREMALGALSKSGADIAVSVTGIAGPSGGSREKPVGLVYTAIAANGSVTVKKLNLSGSREEIRKQTCESVLQDICDFLKKL